MDKTIINKLEYFYRHRDENKSIDSLSKRLLEDDDYKDIVKIYNLRFNPRDLNIPSQIKSVRQLYQKSKPSFTFFQPKDFDDFYQNFYKKRIETQIQKIQKKKNNLYICNAVGHNPVFFISLLGT